MISGIFSKKMSGQYRYYSNIDGGKTAILIQSTEEHIAYSVFDLLERNVPFCIANMIWSYVVAFSWLKYPHLNVYRPTYEAVSYFAPFDDSFFIKDVINTYNLVSASGVLGFANATSHLTLFFNPTSQAISDFMNRHQIQLYRIRPVNEDQLCSICGERSIVAIEKDQYYSIPPV